MSNPAVLTLASMSAIDGFKYRFEIEDNIGESIHVHYKDIRLDLTVKELYFIADKMGTIIDEIVNIEGFSYKDFDPVNLVGLSGILPDLEKITYDEVYLEDLLIDTFDEKGNEVLRPISESRILKALKGYTAENDIRSQVNYYKSGTVQRQTNMERLQYNFEKIKENGYPVNNEYILLFNNDNRIYDGQHRASCLYYLFGNIKIKVRRLWFKHGRHSLGEVIKKEKTKEYSISEDTRIQIMPGKRFKNVCVNMSELPIKPGDYKVVMHKE